MKNIGYSIVREDTSLTRDNSSQAIINRNTNDYYRRLAIKRSEEASKAELDSLKSEVANLKEIINSLILQVKSTK